MLSARFNEVQMHPGETLEIVRADEDGGFALLTLGEQEVSIDLYYDEHGRAVALLHLEQPDCWLSITQPGALGEHARAMLTERTPCM